jgi:hypothetical protein
MGRRPRTERTTRHKVILDTVCIVLGVLRDSRRQRLALSGRDRSGRCFCPLVDPAGSVLVDSVAKPVTSALARVTR